jgi:hypothetical protein
MTGMPLDVPVPRKVIDVMNPFKEQFARGRAPKRRKAV